MPLDFLFGSVKENAERELENYDFETGKRKKDVGDFFGDFITGRGAAIDKKVKELYKQNLDKAYGTDIERINTSVIPGAGSGIQITDRTDPRKLKSQVSTALGKVNAAEQVLASNPYADLSDLTGKESVGTILQTGARQKSDYDKGEEERIYNRGISRQDSLLKWQAMRDDAKDNRQDKRLAQDRRLTAETNQMQLQLEYARLAQSEKNRMQDRKDRAIMTLVSGLGNLGAAFAI